MVGARGPEREADQLVEQPRADVAVPLVAVGARRHLGEIEADDAPPALDHRVDQRGGHLEGEAAWYRGTSVRAEGGVEAVDVEGEIDRGRQRRDDARTLLRPGLAGEARLGQLGVVEADDAPARGAHPLALLLAEVADAH